MVLVGLFAVLAARPCKRWNTHDGKGTNLFRAVMLPGPLPVVGTRSKLAFNLQYNDVDWDRAAEADQNCTATTPKRECQTVTPRWTSLRWEQLEVSHTQKVHAYILSSDGADFYHLHGMAQGSNDTNIEIEVELHQPGSHLVVLTWVVEVEGLDICTVEGVMHAHTKTGKGLFPMLMGSSLLEAIQQPRVSPKSSRRPLSIELSPSRAIACPKQATEDPNNTVAEGIWHYTGSFDLCQDTSTCGLGCIMVDLSWRSVEAPKPPPNGTLPFLLPFPTNHSNAFLPNECLALELKMYDASSGAEVDDFEPYLGAAAHVFIAPRMAQQRQGELAFSFAPSTRHLTDVKQTSTHLLMGGHAHAYPEPVEWYNPRQVTRWRDSEGDKVLCEDQRFEGWVPPRELPTKFGPSLYGMLRLQPSSGWRLFISLRRGSNLYTATFDWKAADNSSFHSQQDAPKPPQPPPSEPLPEYMPPPPLHPLSSFSNSTGQGHQQPSNPPRARKVHPPHPPHSRRRKARKPKPPAPGPPILAAQLALNSLRSPQLYGLPPQQPMHDRGRAPQPANALQSTPSTKPLSSSLPFPKLWHRTWPPPQPPLSSLHYRAWLRTWPPPPSPNRNGLGTLESQLSPARELSTILIVLSFMLACLGLTLCLCHRLHQHPNRLARPAHAAAREAKSFTRLARVDDLSELNPSK